MFWLIFFVAAEASLVAVIVFHVINAITSNREYNAQYNKRKYNKFIKHIANKYRNDNSGTGGICG